ncbi:hypothetical protein, partial [Burkholderia pseudomallei]
MSNASSFMRSAMCAARDSRGALDASNADRNATSSGMFRSRLPLPATRALRYRFLIIFLVESGAHFNLYRSRVAHRSRSFRATRAASLARFALFEARIARTHR